MDNKLYSKAKELKRNIANLNIAISELGRESKGEYASTTVLLETIWCIFFCSSHELRQEFRKFMVDLRDKLQKEFDEL